MRLSRPERNQMIGRQRDSSGAKYGYDGMVFVYAHFDVVMEMQTMEGHLCLGTTDKTFAQMIPTRPAERDARRRFVEMLCGRTASRIILFVRL